MFNEGISIKNNESISTHVLLRDCPAPHPPHGINHVFHYHPYIEIQYVLEGYINTNINNVIYSGYPDDLIIINSHEPHYTAIPENAKFLVIKTMPDILDNTMQTLNEMEYLFHLRNSYNNKNRLIKNATGLKALFEDAYANFKSGEFCSELYVRSDVIRIFAFILQYWKNNKLITPIENKATKENIRIIDALTNMMKSEKKFAISIREAANMCNMSEGYFSRIFKQITNQTFSEYKKSLKMAEAERLLKCTNDSVTDIAHALCYSSTSHFIQEFTKNVGISPKKYRSRISNTI